MLSLAQVTVDCVVHAWGCIYMPHTYEQLCQMLSSDLAHALPCVAGHVCCRCLSARAARTALGGVYSYYSNKVNRIE